MIKLMKIISIAICVTIVTCEQQHSEIFQHDSAVKCVIPSEFVVLEVDDILPSIIAVLHKHGGSITVEDLKRIEDELLCTILQANNTGMIF